MAVRLIEPGPRPGEKREILVPKEEFLMGRGGDCDLRLRSSAVSRHHCLLRVRGDEVVLLDLGSSNGTFVNGQRVRSQTALHSGDELRVGDYRFVVEVDRGEGISWGNESSADQAARTAKLKGQPPEA
jgi:pSer/pThr/pTyr-binding forkhead associated (FHA) protein